MSRSGRLETDGDRAEQCGIWASCGEGDADACGGLNDTSCNLEQAHPQSSELSGGEWMRLGDGVAHRQHEPISSGMQHKAHLIGACRAATGAVGGELALVQLDQVLGLAACAIERVV